MITYFIQIIQSKTSISKDYILLLHLLNAAVLMNFHQFIFSQLAVSITFIFITFIALIDIKYWRILFVNFCISGLILLINFPRIGNHSTFLLISIIMVLVLFFRKILLEKKLSKSLVVYLFRIFLVVVYFYAGFHKLNKDFFNPCVSCVNYINEYNISNITFSNYKISHDISVLIQCFTIILELILPLGLLHYRTRKITTILLLGFHFYLIFAGFVGFASVVLFLIIGGIINFSENENRFSTIRIYVFFIILAIVLRLFMAKIGIDSNQLVFYQGIIFAFGWVYFVVKFIKELKIRPTIFYKKHIYIIAIMVLCISFWSLKTYIGLGNQGNLTMFSNLVTASKHNNHLLIDTDKIRLFNYENDCVKFIDFVNPDNQNDTLSGYYLPMVEFQYYIKHWEEKHHKPIKCVLEYQNKRYEIKNLSQSTFNNGKWWYKYLSFRRIQEDSPNECRW
ncbi:MAG: hypothetical protein ACOVQ2_05510 [Flavobacterium sp.]